jgi:hypothetical protein
MKKYIRPIAALTSILLASCGAVPRSTGVMLLGPDTYRVSARASMARADESQRMALAEANSYCAQLKSQILVVSIERPDPFGPTDVTFRCLKEGDPDLVRPNIERSPDTVIKIR